MFKIKTHFFNKFGQNLFYLGIFLLPSAVFIGAFFILISIFLSIFDKNNNFIKDKWNYPFLICSLLILISTIKNSLANIVNPVINYDQGLAWLSIVHWLPFFFIFYFLQKYLKTEEQRFNTSIALLSGSIPVLASGFLQYFLHWYGPYETFHGLIIWFQKPIDENTQFSGLFSNQNYMGSWLGIVLPFCICALLNNKNKKILKFISFFILIIFVQGIILSTSRNALFGSLTASLISVGLKSFILIGFLILLFVLREKIILFGNLTLENFFPNKLIDKLPDFNINNFANYPRIEIWSAAISDIKDKPFWGWGGSTFTENYLQSGAKWKVQHTHNLFLELSHNFGLILSILLTATILILFFKTFNSVLFNKSHDMNSNINKCWISSTLFILITHFNDITYFDIRISLVSWILLAGNKCILDNQKLITNN